MAMRVVAISLLGILIGGSAHAQGVVTPADVEPPLEIVVPSDPSEELPAPAAEPEVLLPTPRLSSDGQLRPGMFVTSAELYTRVRVKDADDIHPHAVPAIIAVMDPHRDRRARHAQHAGPNLGPNLGLVFVKIFVPPHPPRSVKVKHEEIELDWGEYEIQIESEDGVVEIEYED
jgi:hypothetical protein